MAIIEWLRILIRVLSNNNNNNNNNNKDNNTITKHVAMHDVATAGA